LCFAVYKELAKAPAPADAVSSPRDSIILGIAAIIAGKNQPS
jgi:hypothetical protein